jgi:hypothetical protein
MPRSEEMGRLVILLNKDSEKVFLNEFPIEEYLEAEGSGRQVMEDGSIMYNVSVPIGIYNHIIDEFGKKLDQPYPTINLN